MAHGPNVGTARGRSQGASPESPGVTPGDFRRLPPVIRAGRGVIVGVTKTDGSTPSTITVFLADDNLIVREGVRALLSLEHDLEVVGVGGDYDELVARRPS